MRKITTKKQGKLPESKLNTIVSDIQDILLETEPKHSETILQGITNILCEWDTDIAIEVMDEIRTDEANECSRWVKVTYGY